MSCGIVMEDSLPTLAVWKLGQPFLKVPPLTFSIQGTINTKETEFAMAMQVRNHSLLLYRARPKSPRILSHLGRLQAMNSRMLQRKIRLLTKIPHYPIPRRRLDL